ncbi:hypothetical protein [Coraliomargarita akajimensis]|uniref:Uncharacterized protein n=1 Tax=Coraliomargarita akajimensis (strain DSM 45221 / IAM 15411 / JCM 23193 / KCTC 12865 / 04OKA010-24) TaxID=583355 RepID=D5ENU1_CORAD|nr:hypothetical protein [Coraliomargarita akajimensis]ADE53600.1 hypothetical protein Caka_0575 [Coraliomargarita akajimensis DSM 45221]
MKVTNLLLLFLLIVSTGTLSAKEAFSKKQLGEHLNFEAERINRLHITSPDAEIWHAEDHVVISTTARIAVARFKEKKTEQELKEIRESQWEVIDDIKEQWREFSADVDPRATLYFATFLGVDTPGENSSGFFYVLNGEIIKEDLSGTL